MFDLHTETFTKIKAAPSDDPENAGQTAEKPLPLLNFDLPILTGDVVLVKAMNLTFNDQVEAGVVATDIDLFPRPGVSEVANLV